MANIKLKSVHKSYGSVSVVKDLNLEITDGEFAVLVGPSGCGKSTSLRMIAGLEDITQGDLYFDGIRVNDLAPVSRGVAMVFQSYALYPHMSVFENMAFGLRERREPKAEIMRKVTEAARILQIDHLLERRPKNLSGGQMQRVAMGRAIVREPKVFLFDEPLSNLDASLRAQMRLELTGLHRRLQTTMIYVTHDQVEAMTLADKIFVMNGGRLEQQGTPRAVYSRPANRFVAEFMGAPKMNILDCEATQAKEGAIDIRLNGGVVLTIIFAIKHADISSIRHVGIRPENLKVACQGPNALRAELVQVEDLGGEILIHTKGPFGEAVVKAPFREYCVGEIVYLYADEGSVHLFDVDGKRV